MRCCSTSCPPAGGWPDDRLQPAEQRELCADPQRLARFYALLSSAHYRTSPLDLRRLMDAPGMHFGLAQAGQEVVGAVWLVDEGGLSAELAHDVGLAAAGRAATWWRSRWRRMAASGGRRRCGHGALPASRRCRRYGGRVSRVSWSSGNAVRRRGWIFCRSALAIPSRCGALAILRFRAGAHRQQAGGQQRLLYRDGYLAPERARRGAAARGAQASGARLAWLRQRIELALAIPGDDGDTPLGEEDWRELAGFAFAHRPLEASLGHCSVCCWPAICRCPRCAAICNGGNPRRPARSWRASAGRKPCCATGGTKRRRRWNS